MSDMKPPHTWPWARLRTLWAFILVIFVPSLVLWLSGGNGVFRATSKDFRWLDIEPTRDLVWHPCHKETQIRECARLLVPLNHSDPDPEGPTAAIALVRKPSSYPPSSPLYRGPVLFNPGGPGGSGVDFIMAAGDLFSTILGPEFDIVGFDPRGIGRSMPKVNFFPRVGEREVFGGDGLSVVSSDARKGGRSVESVWARGVIKGGLAGEKMGKTLEFINTEQTAGDMLSITRASGREKVLYWGFSYGTVLGVTFATLYPTKIKRLVLDGVADADNYYTTLWSNNLLDTDKTFSEFFKSCHAAGPEDCAFWAPSPDAIKHNLTSISASLQSQAIPIRSPLSYGVLDYATLRTTLFASLSSPYTMWPALAQALADLAGRGDPLLMWRQLEVPTFKCPCNRDHVCGGKEQKELEMQRFSRDAQMAVMCGDGKEVPEGIEAAREYVKMMNNESEWAELWVNFRLSCSGWPKSKKPFQGPFQAKTSFPILFVGNTADPVTPLAGAQLMSKGFPGSVVLTQNSPGHCSINAPSVCTQKYIRDYFVSGSMPPKGEVCPVTVSPFPGILEEPSMIQKVEDISEILFKDAREMSLHDAVGKLSKVQFIRGFF